MRKYLVILVALVAACAQTRVAVRVEDVTLHDRARNRDVPVRIYVAAGSATAPAIVFSHGAGGSKNGYAYLGEYWAEHGYMSIHPTHAGSDAAALRPNRPLRMMRALRDVTEEPQEWENRARDISFVIDSFADIEQRVPAVHGRLDPSRVGVAGHSYGAQTAALGAGAVIAIDGARRSFSDPRPRAFILMSPQGPGRMGFVEDSWRAITRPAMLMTGTRDRGLAGETPEWRERAFALMPAGDKYLVILDGATHLTFAGLSAPPRLIAAIESLTTAFWDAYVKEGRAAAALTSRPGVRVERK